MQVMQLMPTKFAPAERATDRQLERQVELLGSSPLTQQLLATMPRAVLVLNRHRQIVAANDAFAELLGLESLDAVIGCRPGEALGCMHADLEEGGCGTTDACTDCNTTRVIVASLRGERQTGVCRIPRLNANDALDLEISATPVEVESQFFTVLLASAT
jgi:PAS domain-containing protein